MLPECSGVHKAHVRENVLQKGCGSVSLTRLIRRAEVIISFASPLQCSSF